MADERFLIVRLGSLGDIIHTLPAVHALRAAFPGARLDWALESKWCALLENNPDINRVIAVERGSWRKVCDSISGVRSSKYTCVIDFQGLYKSAVLARLSGAKRRIGFERGFLRESGAAGLYTERVIPRGRHIVEQNLALVEALGAERKEVRFPICVGDVAQAAVQRQLAVHGVEKYFVLSPGGGWGSKCWPAERYGHLHRRLLAMPEYAGWRGVVNFGPGERKLAEAVRLVAGAPEPLILSLDLPQLMALVKGALLFVGGDTGPLHLAAALGTPVVGLYGPTDPERNGPYGGRDIVVRNARADETTYKRGREPAPSMLSISVEQVLEAVEKRLGRKQ